jgi:hypothetical protein
MREGRYIPELKEFNIGDRVRCIDPPILLEKADVWGPAPEIDKVYEVKRIENGFVWVNGVEGGWLGSRFEKVGEEDKEINYSLFNKRYNSRVLKVKREKR